MAAPVVTSAASPVPSTGAGATADARPALSVRRYGEAPGSHDHAHVQVLWALEGTLELEIEGQGHAVCAGHGLMLHPGERHDFASRRGARCLVLDTRDGGWGALARRPEPSAQGALRTLASYLAQAVESAWPQAQDLGPLLLAEAWAGGGRALPSSSTTPHRQPVDWAAMHDWVQARLHHPLTTADLAAWAGLSDSRLRARCLLALGRTPMQWLQSLRLERARALRASGLAVADVARRVGYASPSALTAALRRLDRGEWRREPAAAPATVPAGIEPEA